MAGKHLEIIWSNLLLKVGPQITLKIFYSAEKLQFPTMMTRYILSSEQEQKSKR